jgi:hypothetical protein
MINQFFLKSRHGDFCSSVSFHNKNGAGYGTDLSNLGLFTLEEAQNALDHDIKSIPLLASEVLKFSVDRVDMQYLDETLGKPIARPTFQSKNINMKTMVREPGIKYKKPRPKKMTTGKTRGNCPECGQITWDYNPYENAHCIKHQYEWQRG